MAKIGGGNDALARTTLAATRRSPLRAVYWMGVVVVGALVLVCNAVNFRHVLDRLAETSLPTTTTATTSTTRTRARRVARAMSPSPIESLARRVGVLGALERATLFAALVAFKSAAYALAWPLTALVVGADAVRGRHARHFCPGFTAYSMADRYRDALHQSASLDLLAATTTTTATADRDRPHTMSDDAGARQQQQRRSDQAPPPSSHQDALWRARCTRSVLLPFCARRLYDVVLRGTNNNNDGDDGRTVCALATSNTTTATARS